MGLRLVFLRVFHGCFKDRFHALYYMYIDEYKYMYAYTNVHTVYTCTHVHAHCTRK